MLKKPIIDGLIVSFLAVRHDSSREAGWGLRNKSASPYLSLMEHCNWQGLCHGHTSPGLLFHTVDFAAAWGVGLPWQLCYSTAWSVII
jgi:hypothetical protein